MGNHSDSARVTSTSVEHFRLMALLLLWHAVTVPDADADNDVSTYLSLFLLRAAGFLLPCCIMAWAISILQQQRQRQEATALAATQVAFVLQSGQVLGMHFMIASGPVVFSSRKVFTYRRHEILH